MGPATPTAPKREALSRLERTLLRFGEQPVSTVTFFRGDLAAAAAGVRERAAAVLRANPWLAGRIRRGHLEWQPDADVDLDRFFRVAERGAVQLSRRTPYPQLSAKLRPYLADSVGTPAAPLFRASLLPADAEAGDEASDEGFALVVSLSHIAGDGYTYYRLLNMLTGAEKDVVAMDTRRKAKVLDAIDELAEVEIMYQPGATLAALAGFARGVWRNRWVRGADTAGESLAEEAAAEAGVAGTLPSRYLTFSPGQIRPGGGQVPSALPLPRRCENNLQSMRP